MWKLFRVVADAILGRVSTDLRERVRAAVKGGMSRRQAAAHFRVSVSSAIRWVAQAEATGDLRPKPMGERTVEGLWNAIGKTLERFTPCECANYFEAAGYEPV